MGSKIGRGKKANFMKIGRFLIPVLILIVIFLVRGVFRNSQSTDLQKLLQILPNELGADGSQATEQKLMDKFDKLSQEILRKQDEQMKRFDRERKVLEKKIKELKQPSGFATLREKLAVVFEYGTTQRFPAFVWQTWPYSADDDRMDEDLKGFARNWGDRNPGFVHEIVNDDTASAFVHYFYSSIPEVVEAFDSLPSSILKVDFFKYLVLLARGGVYADIDTDLLQPVPNWIPENVSPKEIGLLVGIEHDSKEPNWEKSFVRRLQFGNWVIQAKPGHPVIREMVAKVTETTLRKKYNGELKSLVKEDLTIMSWTGSGAWTDVIFTYFNDYVQSGVLEKITWKHFHDLDVPKLVGDVLVFPEYTFNAPSEETSSSGKSNAALHFATHKRMKSWIPDSN